MTGSGTSHKTAQTEKRGGSGSVRVESGMKKVRRVRRRNESALRSDGH